MTEKYPSQIESSVEYSEFTVGEKTIALLSDPSEIHAWIRSDHTVDVVE